MKTAHEILQQHIPEQIWSIILPAEEWSTENGPWFSSQNEMLEYIEGTDCLDEILCVISNCADKKTATRVMVTHNPLDVEDWFNDWKREREEEARHQRRDMMGRPD